MFSLVLLEVLVSFLNNSDSQVSLLVVVHVLLQYLLAIILLLGGFRVAIPATVSSLSLGLRIASLAIVLVRSGSLILQLFDA